MRLLALPLILISISEIQSAKAETITLPPRRAGLWEMNSTVNGTSITMWQCISDTIGQFPPQTLDDMTFCDRKDLKKTVEALKARLECKTEKVLVVASANVTGDFRNFMRVETIGSQTDVKTGKILDQTVSVIETKWISACKSDQSPGDIIFPNGKKVNFAR